MQDKIVKCIAAIIFWIVSSVVIAAGCYASYMLLLLMKDMPYGLFSDAVFLGSIAAGIIYIVLDGLYYVNVFRLFYPKRINI